MVEFGIGWVGERARKSLSGTALAFLGTAGTSGAFPAPLVTGALIDATGTYPAAFAYAAVLGVIRLALSYFAPAGQT